MHELGLYPKFAFDDAGRSDLILGEVARIAEVIDHLGVDLYWDSRVSNGPLGVSAVVIKLKAQ